MPRGWDQSHVYGGAVRHAPRLEQMGVDIIVAQGMEAGGHVGTVTTMVLVLSVVDAVSVPVLAAGASSTDAASPPV